MADSPARSIHPTSHFLISDTLQNVFSPQPLLVRVEVDVILLHPVPLDEPQTADEGNCLHGTLDHEDFTGG